ncbi:MAG: type II toxin-antitoxin system PrlF family antitoxin [Acidobacteriota bacterium]|jgi:AbrB family looped-hinge helix DNA binding protein|nr:type II toxin-antitoxin system PrlF family antitoxin [Acidobacteriota bacterium]
MPSTTLTSKGQVTIPKIVRDELGLREGDRVAFRILEDGTVIVEPETVDLLDLKGILKPSRKGVTIAEMDKAIRTAAARR